MLRVPRLWLECDDRFDAGLQKGRVLRRAMRPIRDGAAPGRRYVEVRLEDCTFACIVVVCLLYCTWHTLRLSSWIVGAFRSSPFFSACRRADMEFALFNHRACCAAYVQNIRVSMFITR